MKKIEFQTEDELAGNLRQLKPQGPADLLVDRYDSIFRRGLIEPAEPLNISNRKKGRKSKSKWHESEKGKGAAEFARLNSERKARNDKRGITSAQILKSDLILI